ncbi:hypothetical protein ORS3428_27155 [Mesorhizobium sp. ORS 3428]|nr:hypothetical protein ORS3428_27155 [Mesorhizobium sp. ORS 3428]
MGAVTAEQLEPIYQASLTILREIAIEFSEDTAIRQWKEAGTDVHERRVRLDGEMVMDLMSKAPPHFETTSRDPSQGFEIAPDTMTLDAMQRYIIRIFRGRTRSRRPERPQSPRILYA